MSDGLQQVLDLPESASPEDGSGRSEAAQEFRDRFTAALKPLNAGLQTIATAASTGVHQTATGQRDKLYAAYQKVLSQLNSDGADASGEGSSRVLGAIEALAGKLTGQATEAEQQRAAWADREGDFDDTAAKVAELEEAGHPKAATLRKLVDAIRGKESEREYRDALAAMDQVAPKVDALHEEHTKAAQIGDKRTVAGNGGYTYEQHADGRLFIVKSPKGNKRIELKPEGRTKASYEAVVKEIGPFPTPESTTPPEQPTGSGDASPVLAPLFEAADQAAEMVELATEAITDAVSGVASGVADFFGFGDDPEEAASEAAPAAPPEEQAPPILGDADTPTEVKLAEFADAMKNVSVTVDGQEVEVRPPYHWNKSTRKENAEAARSDNPEVNSLLKKHFKGAYDGQALVGKATPVQMQTFLQEAVDNNLVDDTSADGLRNFLKTYGVSTDCSGLATQAINFLNDNNLNTTADDELNPDGVAVSTIKNWDAVDKPSDLRAGDTMARTAGADHVRLVIDVDKKGDGVYITTLESTSDNDVSEHGEGVGERRYFFPDADSYDGVQVVDSGGATQAAGHLADNYSFSRHESLADRPEEPEPAQPDPAEATGGEHADPQPAESPVRQQAREKLNEIERGLLNLARDMGLNL